MISKAPLSRSEIMSRIGQRDTAPEMAVRRMLHAMGYRFRLHAKELQGRPDIVFRRKKAVIFVHGCFWHGHRVTSCRISHLPKSNSEFWAAKIARNQTRDNRNVEALINSGWRVLEIWECEVKCKPELEARLKAFLDKATNPYLSV